MPVYLIRAGANGPVKIGHSNDPRGRMAELQVAHWETLQIIRVFDGGAPEEAMLHARFSELRLRGEWHSFSTAMLGDVGLTEAALESRPVLLNKIDPRTGKVGRPWTEAERRAAADRRFALYADPVKREAHRAKIRATFAMKRMASELGRTKPAHAGEAA